MFDLETREQTELIRYKRKKAYIRYSTYSNDSVLLFVDDDYIYCQDMAIPRKGGENTVIAERCSSVFVW